MQLSTRNVHGYSVVSISGSIDFFTSPSLERALRDVLANGPEHIVFDLAGVDFVDRSGLAVLTSTATRQRYVDHEVSLIGVGEAVRTALARGDSDLPTYADLEDLMPLAA
jgi:anti-anti-sigma factor